VALDYANEIFRLGDEMIEALGDRLSSERIAVSIGAMDSVPKHLILKLVERAKATHECSVSVSEGHGDELLRELKAHRLDLLIANYAPPVTEGQGLFARKIARMPVVICGARKYANLKRNFPQSLDGQPFVMPSVGSRLRHDLDHYFTLAQIKPLVAVEVQDTSLLKLLGTHGAGVIPIAAPAVAELVESKELTALGELQDVFEELWLIAGERRIQNTVAAKLMKEFSI
jgi:LysR family transcriptional activator of nhaA